MYEPSQIGVPPTEAKTLSDIGNWPYYTRFLKRLQVKNHALSPIGKRLFAQGNSIGRT